MKKLEQLPLDIDLVVEPGHLTKKEMKEFGEFIEQVRQSKKEKRKHRKAA